MISQSLLRAALAVSVAAILIASSSTSLGKTTAGIDINETEVKCSSNGRYVAFRSIVSGVLHLLVMDWQTGERWDVGALKHAPSVSDDGRWIAYFDFPDKHAYVEDVLTHARTRLSDQGTNNSLWTDITPDGRYVVFDARGPRGKRSTSTTAIPMAMACMTKVMASPRWQLAILSASIDPSGAAVMPPFSFPVLASGLRLYATAITWNGQRITATTDPMVIDVQ